MSITIKVNPYKASTIKEAIKELKRYKARLRQFPKAYIEAIAKRFDELLLLNAPAAAKDSEGVAGSWEYKVEDTEEGGAKAIFTFPGETQFIEFGTGIVGAENHEGANMDWAERLPGPYTGYESGPMINKETHLWSYRDESGVLHVTSGQPADPFMYRSIQQIIEEAQEIAKAVLRGEDSGNGQEQ